MKHFSFGDRVQIVNMKCDLNGRIGKIVGKVGIASTGAYIVSFGVPIENNGIFVDNLVRFSAATLYPANLKLLGPTVEVGKFNLPIGD